MRMIIFALLLAISYAQTVCDKFHLTFQATGCPNATPPPAGQVRWWKKQSDAAVFQDMLALCRKNHDYCCGDNKLCKVGYIVCVKQTSFTECSTDSESNQITETNASTKECASKQATALAHEATPSMNDDDMAYFWDNKWPSDTDGCLSGTVLFAQSQIIPSKHRVEGDIQPHLTAKRKTLVLFQPHEDPLSGDVLLIVRDADGNTLSGEEPITMIDPKDIPKQFGWNDDVGDAPELSLETVLETPLKVGDWTMSRKTSQEDRTAFLASKFQKGHNYEVRFEYWDNGSILYLPDGNDVPEGSKLQIDCKGHKLIVKYPDTVNGGWKETTLWRDSVWVWVLTSKRVWVNFKSKAGLHSSYLFGKNFYSTTLDADWVQPGMTLEFQQNEQVGTLNDMKIGGVTELLITTLDAGLLISPRDEFKFAKNPMFHREYFQTVPVTRLVVAPYENLHLAEVMLPSGKLLQKASNTEGGVYTGDMRELTAKELLGQGINNANYGINTSPAKGGMPFTCAQIQAHETRGVYKNGVKVHGLSGGGGLVTLAYGGVGNEFSHEMGHNYGIGHYPAGPSGSVHHPADEINSSWEWDSDLNKFTPNFLSKGTGKNRCLFDDTPPEKCIHPWLGKFTFGRDSMASGAPEWENRYTFYTPYTATIIQNWLESKAIWDPTSSTGFRKYDPKTKKMEEFANTDNKVPRLYRVPVTTIVGYYDADPERRLQSYIFPALYGAYGFVYDGNDEASSDGCSLHVETANRGTLIFDLSTKIDSKRMRKFHVNVATEDEAKIATVFCQNEMLHTRVLEGPKNPSLGYTVNGIPFADDTDSRAPSEDEIDNIDTIEDYQSMSAIHESKYLMVWSAFGMFVTISSFYNACIRKNSEFKPIDDGIEA